MGPTVHGQKIFSRQNVYSLIIGGVIYGVAASHKMHGATPMILGGLGAASGIFVLRHNPQLLQPIHLR